jgi:hypothetical protein
MTGADSAGGRSPVSPTVADPGACLCGGEELTIAPGQQWASTRKLAHRFDVSVKWVHKHRVELGGAKISPASPTSEWRFHVPTADAWMAEQRAQALPAPSRRRRGRRAIARPAAPSAMSFRR